MNSTLLQALDDRLEAVHEQYNLHYAGQMRITRSQRMISLLLEETGSIELQLQQIEANGQSSERQTLLDRCEERKTLYKNELEAIVEAVAEVGPLGVEAAILGTRANFIFHRYRRHFAGKARSTRDIGCLLEMIADLEAIRSEMKRLQGSVQLDSLGRDIEVVDDYHGLLTGERSEFQGARDAGTLEERSGILAEVANGQFQLYEVHFAGLSRVSRRPELLERMIGQLQVVLARMEGLEQVGLHDENNRGNIATVTERVEMWRTEIEKIREVREQTTLLSMAETLNDDAEAVLGLYNEHFAGQDRNSRNPDLLSGLCDRMGEAERQMESVGRAQRLSNNEYNLSMVRDAMTMLENEWQEITGVNDGDDASS